VAQRLAKTIYPASRKLIPLDPGIKIQIEEQLKDLPDEYRKKITIKDEIYDAVPSPECPSGLKGRIAIFEMFKVDKEIEAVILKNPTNAEIYKVARKKGMLMMREDAVIKSIEGIIPFREVYNFSDQS